MRRIRMIPNRRGFTLFELIIGLGILAILAGVILVFVGRARHGSDLDLQKADFQVIAAGLEAYKHDFGDYPRNPNLLSWNTEQNGPTPTPVFYSLAPALLGPGPAVTAPIGGVLETGDGADGFGFRAVVSTSISGSGAVTVGSTTMTLSIDPPDREKASEFVKTFSAPALLTFLATPMQPYPETIAINSARMNGDQLGLTLVAEPISPHDGKCLITVPGGKVWGPYIPPERFKVTYVPSDDSYGSPFFGYGQPALLDRWTQVIQYFPRYPSDKPDASRPWFGDCQSKSVDPVHGESAIFDWRDGTPFFTVTGQTGPAQSWPNPASGTSSAFRPELAVQWMLAPGFDGPYILISVGPGGLERPNGGLCNMADGSNGNNSFPAEQLPQIFASSGNIYNFDRQ